MDTQDVELDGAASPQGPAPGSAPASSSVPHYELDLSAPAADAAAPEKPAASSPALPDPHQQKITALEEQVRLANERAGLAYSAIAPYVQGLQRQAQGPQQPQVTIEQLLNDPNVTTAQLIQWVQQENQRATQTAQQGMELTARRQASELHARGLFHGEGFEGGYDFDALRSKYLTPLYEKMPFLRDVCMAINPEQPALAEYGLATLLELSAAAKDDPVVFYRNLWNFRRGSFDDQGAKITAAAQSAATRVTPGGSGRPSAGQSVRVTDAGIRQMSDAEFEALERQING